MEAHTLETLRLRIDSDAQDLAADPTLTEREFVEYLMPLLAASGVPRRLAGRYMASGDMRSRTDVEIEDLIGGFELLLVERLRQGPDRERIAAGASLCGWLTEYGWQSRAAVVRRVMPDRRVIVSLDDPDTPTEGLRFAADPESGPEARVTAGGVSDADAQQVTAAIARRSGVRRILAAATQVAEIYQLPALVAPEDPVEAEHLRQALAGEPRLARRSLEAATSVLDDRPWQDSYGSVPEAALALWDDTTRADRERMAEMPDRLLALHAQAAVTLRPRPNGRVRRRVRRAVTALIPAARPSLVADLTDSYWDLVTDPVPQDQRVDEATATAMRETAAVHARRFAPLAVEAARAARGDLGDDARSVRRFLTHTWLSP
ncbi:hypothetical protein GZ998_05465 [Actinomyces sp. 594]|uniref:hypothetical protein n=1 Tax=Actinomyces sp. 594 TaxID=2057793 RepID=UPI001C57198D|nr:hypothetical protein [Actinomyces sp. 594]MBW3068961.1 hypothetical protein [Actinomyces sp. 594]